MLPLIAETESAFVIMHMRGTRKPANCGRVRMLFRLRDFSINMPRIGSKSMAIAFDLRLVQENAEHNRAPGS